MMFFSQHVMMENTRCEEENIVKDVRNLSRLKKLKKETTDTTAKDIRNIFRLEKENEEIEYRILRDIRKVFWLEKENKVIKDIILTNIRNLFEIEEEKNYKPAKVNNFGVTMLLKKESYGDKNKTLSVEEYLNKIRPYFKDINNLKNFDTLKIQLTIANNYISSTDNDEELVMHLKSDNIEIIINDEANEVIEKLFESLENRYQNNLELMRGCELVIHYVHLLYYKCH